MINKIIFLSYMPLTKKIYNDFFIDNLIENNFKVEYWNLTKIYYPDLKLSDLIKKSFLYEFTSLKDFNNRLKKENIKSSIFIIYMTYTLKLIKLFRILTKYNATISFFEIGQFPNEFRGNFAVRFFRNPLEFLTYKRIKRFIKHRINRIAYLCKKLNIIKEYDFVFAAGEKQINLFKKKTNVIPINSNDYDNILSLRNVDARLINNKYSLFLDQDRTHHPDIKMLDGGKYVNHDRYYKLLNSFFNIIEKKYKIEIIIAAHPKSNHKINYFNNRKIYKYKTAELVKYCEFVIAEYSSSISYPILYQKPILFFSTNDIINIKGGYDNKAKFFAEYLGCKYYKLDDITKEDNIAINPVNEKKYNKYKYNYLISKESENILTKDIVIDFLRNHFGTKTN